jgi:hypothetical protein
MIKKLLAIAALLVAGTANAGLNQGAAWPVYGNNSGSSAATGFLGEQSTASASGVSLTTTSTSYNIVSQLIQPGDWDLQCSFSFSPAASTTTTFVSGSVSTTSATLGAYAQNALLYLAGITGSTSGSIPLATPVYTLKLSTATTVYCVGNAVFGTSTMTGAATLRWRRAQ